MDEARCGEVCPGTFLSVLRIWSNREMCKLFMNQRKANTPNGNVLFKDTFLKGTLAYLFLFQIISRRHPYLLQLSGIALPPVVAGRRGRWVGTLASPAPLPTVWHHSL